MFAKTGGSNARCVFKVQCFILGWFFSVKYLLKCFIAWFQNVPTTHGKPQAYHRISKDGSLLQACMVYFTPDCFEETPENLVAGYRRRPRLRPNSVPSVFPYSMRESPQTTGQKREQMCTKQAKQEVKRWPYI